MSHVKVFVYGTLRPCDARWAEDAEVAPPVAGTASGALYNYGGYPYADFDGEGRIHGDVLTMDSDHPMFNNVHRVELGAGYVPREVVVTTATESIVCLTFDAGTRVKNQLLPRLPRCPDDDWNNVLAMSRSERYNESQRGVFR